MCFICDGGTDDEFDELVEFNITVLGWHLQGVEGDGGRNPWAYTVGLVERFGHPELAVTGESCAHCMARTLSELCGRVEGGEHFVVGDETEVRGSEVRFGAVHPRQWETDRFNVWLRHYHRRPGAGPEPRALQLIWRNAEGIWQDEPRNPWWRHDRLDRPPTPSGKAGRYVR